MDADLPPPSNTIFKGFLQRAVALNKLRSRAEATGNSADAPLLTRESSEQLIEDCKSLLILDEKSADEICGAALPALQSAFQSIDLSSPGYGTGDADKPPPDGSGPRLDLGGGPPVDLGRIRLPEALKTRLVTKAPTSRAAPPSRAAPSPEAVAAHVAALRTRIRRNLSRARPGVYSGLFLRACRTRGSARGHSRDDARRRRGVLSPERLREPLALLSRQAAESARRDAQRLKRTVSQNLILIPDATELQIAEQALDERIRKLDRVLANPPTQSDYALVVRAIDPEKATLFSPTKRRKLRSSWK